MRQAIGSRARERRVRLGIAALSLPAVLLGIAACARVRPLEGGPADLDPPRLVGAQPPDSAVGLPPQPRFVLEFDENLNARAVRNAVRFEPPLRVRDVRVKGRTVTIELADSLPVDTTIVLVLGEAVQDVAGRDNKLGREIALTYSTAPRLEAAAVAGRVTVRGKPDGRAVVAWQPVPADTGATRRGRRYPAAAANAEGLFLLGGLPPGRRFRLVAFLDGNADLQPDPDELATPHPDTLRLDSGETRRGLAWNVIDPDAPGEWSGIALSGASVPGPLAIAVRRVALAPGGHGDSAAVRGAAAPARRVRADTLRPAPLPVAPRDSSRWGAAFARLEPEGFVPSDWTMVYASPRGDYSIRVAPGRVLWVAFVDARRDSVPGLYVGGDSTRLDWEPLVVGDTVVVAPGEAQRRRTIDIR
jgi:hypothetical protein